MKGKEKGKDGNNKKTENDENQVEENIPKLKALLSRV
jgi:hypothetical protein